MPELVSESGDVAGRGISDVLDAEDSKLVTLARAARARVGAIEGAAVRDQDGRTYAAATVTLPSLALSALQLAVANAVAAGARTVEAASVVTEASTVDGEGFAAVPWHRHREESALTLRCGRLARARQHGHRASTPDGMLLGTL